LVVAFIACAITGLGIVISLMWDGRRISQVSHPTPTMEKLGMFLHL